MSIRLKASITIFYCILINEIYVFIVIYFKSNVCKCNTYYDIYTMYSSYPSLIFPTLSITYTTHRYKIVQIYACHFHRGYFMYLVINSSLFLNDVVTNFDISNMQNVVFCLNFLHFVEIIVLDRFFALKGRL